MSLIKSLAYSAPYYDKVLPFVSSFVAFTVITGLNILLYHLFFRGSFRISPVTVFTILLFVTALSTIAQFHLLGTLFLIQRTALFFVPLFFLLFISILQLIWGHNHTKLPAPGIAVCAAALLVFHFIISANLRSTEDWPFNAYVKEAIQKLDEETAKAGKQPAEVKVGASWIFSPSYFYYNFLREPDEQKHYNWLPETKEGVDYYYLYVDTETPLAKELENCTTIEDYPAGRAWLLKCSGN